jgi:hypothetical protein
MGTGSLRLPPPVRGPGLPGLPRATPIAALIPWPTPIAALIPLPTPTEVWAEVATVVPTVGIAVEVVVAPTALPVVTPPRIPEIAGAPVIRRERTGLGLGNTRSQPQTGKPQTPGHQRGRR